MFIRQSKDLSSKARPIHSNFTDILHSLHIDHSIEDLEKQPVATLRGRALHDYIDELQIDFADIHRELAQQYFMH